MSACQCPGCRLWLSADVPAGQPVRCPRCQTAFGGVGPGAGASAAAPPLASASASVSAPASAPARALAPVSVSAPAPAPASVSTPASALASAPGPQPPGAATVSPPPGVGVVDRGDGGEWGFWTWVLGGTGGAVLLTVVAAGVVARLGRSGPGAARAPPTPAPRSPP